VNKIAALRLLQLVTQFEPPGTLRLLTRSFFSGSWDGEEGWPPSVRVRGKAHGYEMALDLSDPVERVTYCLRRYYETDVLMALDRLLKPGFSFVDGGANIGMITLHAAHRVGPSGKVLAFEPNPGVFRRLLGHVRVNRLEQVEPIECALGGSRAAPT
jgi:hypothetical protein